MSERKIKIKIEADGDQADATVKRLESSIKDMSSQSVGLAATMATAFGSFIGGFAAGSVQELISQLSRLPSVIKGLAVQFAETGSQIYDTSQQVSLSAETALKNAQKEA